MINVLNESGRARTLRVAADVGRARTLRVAAEGTRDND